MSTPALDSTVDILCDALRKEIRRTVTISATEQEVYVSRRAGVLLDMVRTRLRSAEADKAEIERLRAALAEAEERAAGPFFATCDGLDDAEYGRRLEAVMDRLYERLGESLEEEYEPVEWAAVVAGWEMTVGHGVELVPVLDDDGEPRMDLRAAAGWWYYDLRLTVTPDGQPVLTAERRAGGAR